MRRCGAQGPLPGPLRMLLLPPLPPPLPLPLLLLLLLCGPPAAVHGCDSAQSLCGAFAPGDVLVGILLPCHRKVTAVQERIAPGIFHCSDFDLSSFVRSMAVVFEIERVNRAGLLPGVRLGYLLCDTCTYASKALQDVEHMLALNSSERLKCDNTEFRPAVKVIFGARYSEVTIAVAKLTNVYMVPLLSSSSTSPELSDKTSNPSALRTVPSDRHQTKAIANLMSYYGWNWVGVVYVDDDYGKAAFQSFVRNAEEYGVCLAFQEKVHHYLDHSHSDARAGQVAEAVRSSDAKVVLLILKDELVRLLFREMLRTGTSRVWIASDAWSRSSSLARMDGINRVGDILGFTFASSRSESFDGYLGNLAAPEGGYNHFLEEYKNLRFNCSGSLRSEVDGACDPADPQEQNDDFLVKATDTSEPYMHRVAVWAVANALQKLLECNGSACTGEIDFPPWKLLKELKKVRFEFENQEYFFDDNGDFVNGYDLVVWEKDGPGRRFQKKGRYNIFRGQIELDGGEPFWLLTDNATIPRSRCSERCRPGTVKKILNISCCYTCIPCEEGKYSDEWDLQDCKACPNGTWSLKEWTHCRPRSEFFLRWHEPHPITMVTAAVFGVLLLLVVLVVFLVYRESQPMRRAEVRLSCVMMAGLAVSFASVVCFMGKPSTHICRARQLMYAMGFTLCVACVLVKAYRTFLVFLPFGQLMHRRLHKFYKPPAIIVALMVLQAVICLLWLVFDSPDVDDTPPPLQSMRRMLQCREGKTFIGFGTMLGYIALLALIGFLLAFKGRKVPQEFSETGYIIFSMLMYLFVWVCFIPVYITSAEDGTRVQASAILVSSYGIIFCHFLPKCYEVLWASNTDTLENILRRWRVKTEKADKEIPQIVLPSETKLPASSSSASLWSSSTPGGGSPTDSEGSLRTLCSQMTRGHPPPSGQGTVMTRRRRSV